MSDGCCLFVPVRSFHSIQHIIAKGSFHCLCSPTATIYIDFYQYKARALCSVYFCWLCNCVWYSFVDTRPGLRVHKSASARARFCYLMCSIGLLWPGSFNFALSILSFTSLAHHSACCCVCACFMNNFQAVLLNNNIMWQMVTNYATKMCMCMPTHSLNGTE